MQRKINIDVTGNRARVSSRELGTQGEVAAVTLLLTFDGSWNGLAKRLVWRAADGSSSGYTLLTEPDAEGVYSASVPALPLSAAGRAELSVEGVETSDDTVERRARSVLLSFRVEPNDVTADSETTAVEADVADQLASALEGKAALSHTHTKSDVTDFSHTHTKSEVTDFSHTHAQSEVTGLTSALSGKAAASHTHAQSEVTGLTSALSGKAASSHTHAQSDVTGLSAALSGKAAASHTHTKSAITDFSHTHTKSDVTDFSHTHAQSDVTGLSTALSGKAAASHTHAQSDVTGLSAALSGKAAASHTHASTDVSYTRSGITLSLKDTLDGIISAAADSNVGEYVVDLDEDEWSGVTAPYTQSIHHAMLSSSSHVIVGVDSSASDDEFEAACAAMLRFSLGSETLYVKAYGEKPTETIPLVLGVIR